MGLFLKAFWPYILVAAVVAGLGIYIGTLKFEVSHYKSQVAKITAEYSAYKLEAEHQAKALQDTNKEITEKHALVLKATNEELDKVNKELKERIKRDKASSNIKLPSSVVGLFNESSRQGQRTSQAIPPDARETSTTQGTQPPGVKPIEFNLNELLLVVDDNNKEHWKCIRQVEEWQSFWSDFETGVSNVLATQQPPH